MSDEELEKTLSALSRLTAELTSSPEKARAFLVEEGFFTADGEWTDAYKQNA